MYGFISKEDGMIQNEQIESLLVRYYNGELDEKEVQDIKAWIDASAANRKIASEVYHICFAADSYMMETKTGEALARTRKRIASGRFRRAVKAIERIAAALLLVLSGCSLLPGPAQAEIQPEPASLVQEGSGFLDYAEDLDEVLTSEQEQILHDYFSRQYLALAKQESTSFGELFSDAQQADYADAALDLQLELRRMQPLDYSLTGFEYELEVESITTLEDGSIRIRLTEDSVQNFTALPGVDSRRLGTSHHFVLESTGDRWLIRSHTLFDPLPSTLLYEYMDEYAGGQWDPGFLRDLDFSQDYIDAVMTGKPRWPMPISGWRTAAPTGRTIPRTAATVRTMRPRCFWPAVSPWTFRVIASGNGMMIPSPTAIPPMDAPAPGRGSSSSWTMLPAIPASVWWQR